MCVQIGPFAAGAIISVQVIEESQIKSLIKAIVEWKGAVKVHVCWKLIVGTIIEVFANKHICLYLRRYQL